MLYTISRWSVALLVVMLRHGASNCYRDEISDLPNQRRTISSVRCCCDTTCPSDPSCIWLRQIRNSTMLGGKKELGDAVAPPLPPGYHWEEGLPRGSAPARNRPPGRCAVMALGKHVATSSLVAAENFADMERYGDVVRCGSAAVLVTRQEFIRGEGADRQLYWNTVLRWQRADSKGLAFGAPQQAMLHEFQGHNAAGVCLGDNRTLAFFGGRDRSNRRPDEGQVIEKGVSRSTVPAFQEALPARRSRRGPAPPELPEVVLSGDRVATHCVERRVVGEKWMPRCEYDGKLSLVRRGDGGLLLYARANVQPAHYGPYFGGRHSQVAESFDDGKTWGKFRLVTFGDYKLDVRNNIYFMLVERFTTSAGDERFVAVFPAIIDYRGGIFVAFSLDGVDFTAPQRIMESAIFQGGRTPDHPADIRVQSLGDEMSGTRVTVLVQHAVHIPGVVGPKGVPPRPYFCEYVVNANGWLFA